MHHAVQNVALADEIRHKGVFRLVVNVFRGTDLLDAALVHDHDGVAHGQRLLLIVGHVDEGDAQLLLDTLEFALHILPQAQVQSPQWFVQQQYLGPVHQCPGDGYPLLLPAGQLRDPPVLEALQTYDLQHLQHPLADLLLGNLHLFLSSLHRLRLGDPQAEGHVLKDVEMGEQGVPLEDSVDLPLIGRNIVNPHPVEQHFSRSGRQKASNDAQGRCLAAATGSEQCEELTVIEI